MKKSTVLIILCIIFILLLAAAGYFLFKPEGVQQSLIATTTPQVTVEQENPSITSTTTTEENTIYSYQITVSYPIVAGLSNPVANQAINNDILRAVKSDKDSFKSGESENSEMGVGGPDSDGSTLTITYEQQAAVSGVLSFALTQEYYSAGAAHPGSETVALNYDEHTGQPITLDTLFTGNYLATLSKESSTLLTKQLGADADKENIASGTSADADNFAVFFPTPSGLKIIFNQYQVASYAAGIQTVVIPYSHLQSVINPNGPLKGL